MRFRHLLFLAPLALSAPLLAQPSGGTAGPWAADVDQDGRITRDEMAAYMDRRFGLMDQDGDGLVPVQAMQRMLGHERDRVSAQVGPREGRGPGKGRGGHRNGGGPPPGGHRPDGNRAETGGPPPPPPGRAMPYPEDGNDDGQIDRTEFVGPALAMFDDRDRDGDGVLTAEELPLQAGGDGPRSGD